MPQKFVLSSSLIIIISALFISCEGPEGPAGPVGDTQIWVDASISSNYYWSNGTGATVVINNCPVIPCVMIDATVLNLLPGSGNGEGDLCAGILFFEHDNIDILPGGKASLSVEYIDESGEYRTITGEVNLPGEFQILEPDTSAIDIVLGENLTFTWSSAVFAAGYRVIFTRNVVFNDLNGEHLYHNYYFNSVISDTSITFLNQDINPDTTSISEVIVAVGNFYLLACSGPCAANDDPNIAGDGEGYFRGYTFGGEVDCDSW